MGSTANVRIQRLKIIAKEAGREGRKNPQYLLGVK
jgi:hypothetical protein